MKSFIFDLNGTMINDMPFHTRAWQYLLNDKLGSNFSWDEIKPQMYGKNPEVLVRMFGPDRFKMDEMIALSFEKEKMYQQEYLPHLELLPGLRKFLENAHQKGFKMAIGSAAIPFNINFVLDNLNIRHYFNAIVSADDVELSKPHPQTFSQAASLLKADAADCVVFEDVPKGAEAANNAGMKAIILTTTHQREDFGQANNVLHFAEDYNDPFITTLLAQ